MFTHHPFFTSILGYLAKGCMAETYVSLQGTCRYLPTSAVYRVIQVRRTAWGKTISFLLVGTHYDFFYFSKPLDYSYRINDL